MRRSLFSSLPVVLFIACNGNAGNSPLPQDATATDSSRIGTAVADPDTSAVRVTDEAAVGTPKTDTRVNEASKELKASKAEGSAPVRSPEVAGSGVREHGAPNKSALDSLKEAKSKGKK